MYFFRKGSLDSMEVYTSTILVMTYDERIKKLHLFGYVSHDSILLCESDDLLFRTIDIYLFGQMALFVDIHCSRLRIWYIFARIYLSNDAQVCYFSFYKEISAGLLVWIYFENYRGALSPLPVYTGLECRRLIPTIKLKRSMEDYSTFILETRPPSLHWRHDRRDCVSNHQPHDCLLNRLFNSPHKGPVTRKIFPFDDVIMVVQATRYLS